MTSVTALLLARPGVGIEEKRRNNPMHSGTKTYLPLPKSANVARDDRISAATARLSAMACAV